MTKKEKGQKEIKTLKTMINSWYEAYRKHIPEDGEIDHLVHDFREEIEIYIYPYLGRLIKTGHITNEEASTVITHFASVLEKLKNEAFLQNKRYNSFLQRIIRKAKSIRRK